MSLMALAFALAMDAFAVAMAAGLALDPLTRRQVFRLSFHFGLFQALMPVIGWSAGRAVSRLIETSDHWIAFGLLGYVGVRMIAGALRGGEAPRTPSDPTAGWDLVMLSLATSIDALAVGLSLAVIGSPIVMPAVVIGIVAGVMTLIGMLVGRRIGAAWGPRVEIAGGIVLLAIGCKILFDHLSG